MTSDGEGRRRVGIFGGTFDPIHLGHLAVAQDTLEALSLDRVVFIPAGRPPHKSGHGITPGALRLRMVRAAVEGDERFAVSDVELRREGPSWTVDTLRELREQDQDAEYFLLMGVDQWAGFGGWREPREISELARIVVMARSGESPGDRMPAFSDMAPPPAHLEVQVTRLDLSSSEIRSRVRSDRSIRYLVPEPVLGIIEASKMYL